MSKLYSYFLVFLGCLIIILGYVRLYYGVDFLDEAWYVSTVHQFSLGGIPFLNEISLQQFSFIFLSPLYNFFLNVNFFGLGNILFVRHIYFLLVCLTSLVTYKLLIKYIPKSVSFVLSSIYFIDVFVIPSISYNTMGRLLLIMGIALLTEVYSSKKQIFWINLLKSIIVGFILTICFFSYFPLIIVILVFFGLTIFYIRNTNKKLYPITVTIISFVFISVCFFFRYIYPEIKNVSIDIEMIKVMAVYSFNLVEKIKRIGSMGQLFLISLVILIIFKKSEIKFKKISSFLFLLAIIIILFFSLIDYKDHVLQYIKLVSLFSFVGLIGYPLFYKQLSKNISLIYFLIIIPVCMAGVITGLTSANGYTNMAVGISPAVIFSLLIIYKKFISINKNINHFVVLISVISVVYVFLLFSTIYGESSLFLLTKKVTDGPYKNLYTTPEKAKFVNDVLVDLSEIDIKNKTILCYYNFPACYLFTSLKMNFYSTWTMNWWMSKKSFDDILVLNEKRNIDINSSPDVVFRYKYNDESYIGTMVGEKSTIGYDPIANVFLINENNYILKKKTDDYKILIKK